MKDTKAPSVTTQNATGMKICHPSVCVGGAQPSSCVCPTKPKK